MRYHHRVTISCAPYRAYRPRTRALPRRGSSASGVLCDLVPDWDRKGNPGGAWGRSWAIENAQTVKTEFGLDHNETPPSMAGTDTVRRLDGAGEFCLNRLGVSNKSATRWSVSASAAQRLR